MTLGAVCVGLTSVRFALDGRIDMAVIALVVMILDDMMAVLRALNSTSRIGKELNRWLTFSISHRTELILHLALFMIRLS